MDGADGVYIASGALSTIAGVAITYLKMRKPQPRTIENDPLNVNKLDKYVTRGEFNAHVADNARDHENLFARLNANDKMTSKLDGILTTILSDLQDIKKRLWTIPTDM